MSSSRIQQYEVSTHKTHGSIPRNSKALYYYMYVLLWHTRRSAIVLWDLKISGNEDGRVLMLTSHSWSFSHQMSDRRWTKSHLKRQKQRDMKKRLILFSSIINETTFTDAVQNHDRPVITPLRQLVSRKTLSRSSFCLSCGVKMDTVFWTHHQISVVLPRSTFFNRALQFSSLHKI